MLAEYFRSIEDSNGGADDDNDDAGRPSHSGQQGGQQGFPLPLPRRNTKSDSLFVETGGVRKASVVETHVDGPNLFSVGESAEEGQENKGKKKHSNAPNDDDDDDGVLQVKGRKRVCGRWKLISFFVICIVLGALGAYLAYTWPNPLKSPFSDEDGKSSSSSSSSGDASNPRSTRTSSALTFLAEEDGEKLVKLDFSVLFNSEVLADPAANVEQAVSRLRGNVEESLGISGKSNGNGTATQYFAQFNGDPSASVKEEEETAFFALCSEENATGMSQISVRRVEGSLQQSHNTVLFEADDVDVSTLPALARSEQNQTSTAYCISVASNEDGGSRRSRRSRMRRVLQDADAVSASTTSFRLGDLGVRLKMSVETSTSNIYRLNDMLMMTFESEALHLALIHDNVIKSVDVSASAFSQGVGAGGNNFTTEMGLMSGLPLKKNPDEVFSDVTNRNNILLEKYLEEVHEATKETNIEGETNTTAEAPSPSSPPPSPSSPSPSPSPSPSETKNANGRAVAPCEAVPYGDTFLHFVDSMQKKNDILSRINGEEVQGNRSILFTNATSLDWAKPPCAVTNHTYYPAVFAFRGVDEFGLVEMKCGQDYRKYDSQTGIISTVKTANMTAYFYDDGSLEATWTNETGWINFSKGELFYPATHESNLTLWTLHEDGSRIKSVPRPLIPRWADAMPCQYYKEFDDCLANAHRTPLKLALVVLHWNDTDPQQIDMELMKTLYANELIEKYWQEMSYGSMKKIEFETFGPVNMNLDEFYDIGESQEEIKFCMGSKTEDGILVREGGGCGTRGCTYISPNVVSGLYSDFDLTTNVSCIPGWRSENFFGTVFLTYSSKGCGGAGLFNSVFSMWIDGEFKKLRAISMAHRGPYESCSGGSCTFYDHSLGNVEPRYMNETQPKNWDHPLNQSSVVETHELVHLFGVSWHSSAKLCDSDATDFRKCKHREYGNEFSLVGGAGAALELPAYERYSLHFLNASNVLVVEGEGSFQIGPISNFLKGAQYRAAVVVTEEYSIWLEYRRPVGYDTSLEWPDYEENTKGLLATVLNDLVDLSPGVPEQDKTLYRVTLNAGCSWQPFGTNLVIGNVLELGDVGIKFTVSNSSVVNTNTYGVTCTG